MPILVLNSKFLLRFRSNLPVVSNLTAMNAWDGISMVTFNFLIPLLLRRGFKLAFYNNTFSGFHLLLLPWICLRKLSGQVRLFIITSFYLPIAICLFLLPFAFFYCHLPFLSLFAFFFISICLFLFAISMSQVGSGPSKLKEEGKRDSWRKWHRWLSACIALKDVHVILYVYFCIM